MSDKYPGGLVTAAAPAGYSVFFNGTSSYLQVPDNAAFEIGSGAFTFESWIYLTGYSPSYGGAGALFAAQIINKDDNAARSYTMQVIGTSTSWTSLVVNLFSNNTTLVTTSASFNFALNTWYHVAAVRSGTSLRLYVNGADIGGGTNSTTAQDTSAAVQVGSESPYWVSQGYGYYFPGYLSNVRIVKGTAVYTSAFTPPTAPLTNITNTSLLTCQSNRFVDNGTANSGSGFAITVNGDTSVQAFSPFLPTIPYSAATVGGSGYFDGTGDFLSIANNTALNVGSGDFCIEAWFNASTLASQQIIVSNAGAFGSDNTQIDVVSSQVRFGSSATVWLTSSGTVVVNAWNHVAACRSGTTLSLFVNGSRQATATNSTNFANANNYAFNTGGAPGFGGQFTGYISNVRVVKGSSVYDPTQTSITIPTAPPTAITNTSLLCNYTNAGIIDATAKNVLETVGNASISTAQSKFGGSSMFFDGTGDYLSATPKIQSNAMGNANATIEMWVYTANSSSSLKCLVDTRSGQNTDTGFGIYQISNNVVIYGAGVKGNAASQLTGNTWVHLAVTRANITNYVFINGTLYNTFSYGNTLTSSNVTIGSDVAGSNAFTGYIDDLRITNGFARYTANFTPTTEAFPLQ